MIYLNIYIIIGVILLFILKGAIIEIAKEACEDMGGVFSDGVIVIVGYVIFVLLWPVWMLDALWNYVRKKL